MVGHPRPITSVPDMADVPGSSIADAPTPNGRTAASPHDAGHHLRGDAATSWSVAEESARASSPRVSIGMPVRNGEAFIRQGIESLLGQTMSEIELIISDNASTDATEAICREWARRDARVRYSRTDRNIGLQANFARVLDLATAPYFMWGCHDDHWDPSYVAKMVEVLDSQPSVVLAGSNSGSIDQDGVTRRHLTT